MGIPSETMTMALWSTPWATKSGANAEPQFRVQIPSDNTLFCRAGIPQPNAYDAAVITEKKITCVPIA